MLTPAKIARLASSKRFGPLLDEVTRNGHPLPERLRARLAEAHNIEVASIALGLQRLVELDSLPGGAAQGPLASMATLLSTACESPAASPAALAMALGAAADASDHLESSTWGAAPVESTDLTLIELAHLTHTLVTRLGLGEAPSKGDGDALDAATLVWQVAAAPRIDARAPSVRERAHAIESALTRQPSPDPAVRDLLRRARAASFGTRRAA